MAKKAGVRKINKRLNKLRKWAQRPDDHRQEEAQRRLAHVAAHRLKKHCCGKKKLCTRCPQHHATIIRAAMPKRSP